MKPDLEIVDIEDYAKQDRQPPKAARYRIRIDKDPFVVDVPRMTGRQLLELAGKTPPDRFKISEKIKGGPPVPIGLEDYADFTKKGVERFRTLPLDQTEGCEKFPEPRRQFTLTVEDEAALNRMGYPWETLKEGDAQWLLIHKRPVVSGYTLDRACVALNIHPGYPDVQIDMAYFHPDLTPVKPRTINNLSAHQIDGKQWQRWSRHRTPANPWRPGIDDVESHLEQVDHWLRKAVGSQERAA
jgi:hypothetical protein